MLQRQKSVVLRSAVAGIVGIAFAALGMVAGCGQKGPLMLPKPPPSAASASAPASAASPS